MAEIYGVTDPKFLKLGYMPADPSGLNRHFLKGDINLVKSLKKAKKSKVEIYGSIPLGFLKLGWRRRGCIITQNPTKSNKNTSVESKEKKSTVSGLRFLKFGNSWGLPERVPTANISKQQLAPSIGPPIGLSTPLADKPNKIAEGSK